MTDLIGEVCAPKVLIAPTLTPLTAANKAPIGSLCMSGAKLYVSTAVGTWSLITSA